MLRDRRSVHLLGGRGEYTVREHVQQIGWRDSVARCQRGRLAHYTTRVPTSALFWAAYVLTRPLGATLGDILTKPPSQGGLNLSRITSSLVIAVIMVIFISMTSLRKRAKAA